MRNRKAYRRFCLEQAAKAQRHYAENWRLYSARWGYRWLTRYARWEREADEQRHYDGWKAHVTAVIGTD